MSFDDKISRSLKEHSEWTGDPNKMWQAIQSDLEQKKKTPWWQAQHLWLGSAVAATIFLVFWMQNFLTPQPLIQPEVQVTPQVTPQIASKMAPHMRQLSVQFSTTAPLVIDPGTELPIYLDLEPKTANEVTSSTATLEIVALADNSQVILQKINLNDEVLATQTLLVSAPLEPGHYLITVQGSVLTKKASFTVSGHQELIVQAEKDDLNVQKEF